MNDMSCDLKKLKSYYMQFPGVGSLYYYWSVVESKVMTKFECKDKDKAGSTGMTDMQFRFKSNK